MESKNHPIEKENPPLLGSILIFQGVCFFLHLFFSSIEPLENSVEPYEGLESPICERRAYLMKQDMYFRKEDARQNTG